MIYGWSSDVIFVRVIIRLQNRQEWMCILNMLPMGLNYSANLDTLDAWKRLLYTWQPGVLYVC